MARLPVPGSDSGTWGDVLNDFLNVAHTTAGALKTGSVGDDQISSISQSKVSGLTTALSNKADNTVTYGTTARVFYDADAAAYPNRPTGFTSVEWIGPLAPTIGVGANHARDGYDTWINTA